MHFVDSVLKMTDKTKAQFQCLWLMQFRWELKAR